VNAVFGQQVPEQSAPIIGIGFTCQALPTVHHCMISSAPISTGPSDDARLVSLRAWLRSLAPSYGLIESSLRPASVDASSRRYFRVDAGEGSLIAMDAPPATEDSRPFVQVAELMRVAGVHVPDILVTDLGQGFLLLSDLGAETYLASLSDSNADQLFGDAVDALIRWQLSTADGVLPPYDEALLRRELNLFPDWFIARHLQQPLTAAQNAALAQMFSRIVTVNLAQPRVFVHRDYMPRNLMVSKPNPGVLDFQDAVTGPISYDVVSLFRDAFISWDNARVLEWVRLYFDRAQAIGLPVGTDFDTFWRDFEWMGLQRHLKVLGIFARIRYRDGKPHYLTDAPRFIGYVRSVVERYNELAPLARLFDELGLA
jgi:aminoglycoside/choline kinase family phosphotransferase